MKNKYLLVFLMLCVILAVSMGLTTLYVTHGREENVQQEFTVVTSFYPIYLATLNVAKDIPGVKVENLSEPQTGCLHDFQLTPEDMKRLSTADVFVVNGGGIESFLEEVASSYSRLKIIQACEPVELLNDGEESNAHAWMSPARYREMVQYIALELSAADRAHESAYQRNADAYDARIEELEKRREALAVTARGTNVILFHEALDYVAEDYGMQVRFVMDLDEERQISAGEIADVVAAVQEGRASLILAEERYGRELAELVQKETDVAVLYLDPLTRGSYDPDSYLSGMEHNIELLQQYFDTRVKS